MARSPLLPYWQKFRQPSQDFGSPILPYWQNLRQTSQDSRSALNADG